MSEATHHMLIQDFQFSVDPQHPHALRVYGTVEHPWFVAREIALILGLESSYRNFVAGLDSDEKQSCALATKGGRQQMTLITESAVYKMIFKSRKPIALKFQNWICKEVIPALRRQTADTLQRQVEQLNHLLENQQRATQQLGTYVENMRFRQSDQVIYIATSQYYATQNSFKVGGCTSESLLRKRLTTYNSGRAAGDELYYAALFKCHNHQHVEARIKELLLDFRMQKQKEMYILPYDVLYNFIARIIGHHQSEVDQLNDVLRNLLDTITHTPAVIPAPLDASLTSPQKDNPDCDEADSSPPVETIDFDSLTHEEQQKWIQKWVDTYRLEHPYPIILRKSFEHFVEQQEGFTVKFRKLTLWNHLKQLANSVQEFTAKYL